MQGWWKVSGWNVVKAVKFVMISKLVEIFSKICCAQLSKIGLQGKKNDYQENFFSLGRLTQNDF